MAQLTNDANLEVVIAGLTETVQSAVTVELNDVWFNKTADKDTWINGFLTYTIEIKNNGDPAADPPGEPLTNAVFADTIDPAIARVMENTIAVDPESAYISHTYNETTGELVIQLDDIPAGEVVVISFQVERVL